MVWYKATFPDTGGRDSHAELYVEGASEADARATVSYHERYSMYDVEAGTLEAINGAQDDIEQHLADTATPDEAVTSDGDVLLRDADENAVTVV